MDNNYIERLNALFMELNNIIMELQKEKEDRTKYFKVLPFIPKQENEELIKKNK